MSGTVERTYLELGFIRDEIPDSPLWVIPKETCTRCGACHVICPTNVVKFDSAEFPYIDTSGCIDCGLCLKVCPGIDFNVQKYHQQMFSADYMLDRMGGYYRSAYVGYSTNAKTRAEGSSGGIVTQLLVSLLKLGMIDGALVVGSSPDDPLNVIPYIARTEEEIKAAAQSKYVVVANTKSLRDLRNTQERIAFVGLSCQVHGLKKLEELNKRLSQRIVLTIGLACRGTLEREVVPEFLDLRGIHQENVSKVGFRDGDFPGKIRAWLKDGSVRALHRHEVKDGAYNNLFRLYLPERCISCPDYSAEFSDIMCSDIWTRAKSGDYLHSKGVTMVLCRTERGEQIIDLIRESGDIHLDPIQASDVEKAYKRIRWEKKVLPFVRIAERKRSGKLAADYGVSVPMTGMDQVKGYLYGKTFIFGKNRTVRRIVMYLIFSPLGEGMLFVKIKIKKYYNRLKAKMAS